MNRDGRDECDELADEMIGVLSVAEQVGYGDRLQYLIAEEYRRTVKKYGLEPISIDLWLWLSVSGIPERLKELHRLEVELQWIKDGNPKIDLGMTKKERDTERCRLEVDSKNLRAKLDVLMPPEPDPKRRGRGKEPTTIELEQRVAEHRQKSGRMPNKEQFNRYAAIVYGKHSKALPVAKRLGALYREILKGMEPPR